MCYGINRRMKQSEKVRSFSLLVNVTLAPVERTRKRPGVKGGLMIRNPGKLNLRVPSAFQKMLKPRH